MRYGGSAHGNLHEIFLGILDALADCVGNFARFTHTEADCAFTVAHHNNGGELENPAALNRLGNTVNSHDTLGQIQS